MLIKILTTLFVLILLVEGAYLLSHRHRPLFNFNERKIDSQFRIFIVTFWGITMSLLALVIELLTFTASSVTTLVSIAIACLLELVMTLNLSKMII